ncbi:PREDICTED: putative F-box protein At1g61060 [Camelina sativa]|uniref:F-box protein At1g61060 n=1 Tax=Camelina sativa TaxID=90675 RepID=A0ABM1RC88_CAMSA|nr:PREDICTED: putative F-box protein At1g61060 [Camelina sativa]
MNQRRSSSTSREETEYLDLIPVDLFISNILSRLPVESLAQCRCVSKLWSSIIRHPNYKILFPIKSQAPPRILFIIEYEGSLFFYSSPQPQNPDQNTSLVATFHHSHRTRGSDFGVCRPPVGGLVCRQHVLENGSKVAVICNPITGEYLALPKLGINETKSECRSNAYDKHSFGYDPIDKELKILRITSFLNNSFFNTRYFGQYRVLTLGTGNKNLLWRKIQCCTIHHRIDDDKTICINGFLYYPAVFQKGKIHCSAIACFDVRSETFSFTNFDQDMSLIRVDSFRFTLIDYKGKLGACRCDCFDNIFELWVLEDAQRHKWSKHIYQMLNPLLHFASVVGMIGSCEIVLCPCFPEDPLFIFYYNLETNIVTRVKIEAPVLHSGCWVHAFPNYVEDLTLM